MAEKTNDEDIAAKINDTSDAGSPSACIHSLREAFSSLPNKALPHLVAMYPPKTCQDDDGDILDNEGNIIVKFLVALHLN